MIKATALSDGDGDVYSEKGRIKIGKYGKGKEN